MRARSVLLLGVLASTGCGANVEVATGGAGGATSTHATGTASTASSMANACPSALPAAASACAPEGLFCSYGDDPRASCRATAECKGGAWSVLSPKCAGLGGPADCGTTPPADMTICSAESLVCAYPDGTLCGCSSCDGGPCGPPPPHWHCTAPEVGCDTLLPNAGTACPVEGLDCVYGQPCGVAGGVETKCAGGEWVWLPGQGCPL